MADVNVGQDVATVYEKHYGTKPTDNIFNSFALWKALGARGFKEQADGGRLIEETIMYAENTTQAAIAPTGTISTNIIDVFDAARFDWKVYAGTCSYGWLEELKARGASAKIDLIAEKIENARNSQIALLNRDAWNTSTPTALQLTAVPTLIAEDPTTGIVGGINGGTYSFWRNRVASGTNTGTAFNALRSAGTSVFNQCSLGGAEKTPTFSITSRTVLEGLEGTMTSLIRYTSEDRKNDGDPSFMNNALKFKGIPAVYDEDAPSDDWFFLNPMFLKFRHLSGGLLKLHPEVQPANQLTNVHKLSTAGNLSVSARRHLGRVYNIT